jgi:hypothetical protein
MNIAFTAILALLEKLLPIVASGGGAATGIAGSIISVLETWLPLIETLTEAFYTPIKNIITSLQSSGAVTADQITSLQALDKQVDDAFDAASAGQDPDAAPITS